MGFITTLLQKGLCTTGAAGRGGAVLIPPGSEVLNPEVQSQAAPWEAQRRAPGVCKDHS